MHLLRTIALLFVCFSMFAGPVASAARADCCMGAMMMQDDMATPCHDSDHGRAKAQQPCGCDCQYIVKMSSLTSRVVTLPAKVSDIPQGTSPSFYSLQNDALYQPPRPLS